VSEIIRAASALTTSYVSSRVINIQGANQVQLLVSFTKGNSAGCRLKIEYSEDQTTWYQESMVSEFPSANDVKHTLVTRKIEDTGNYVLSIPVSASFFRVSAQAIMSGDNTSLSILVIMAHI